KTKRKISIFIGCLVLFCSSHDLCFHGVMGPIPRSLVTFLQQQRTMGKAKEEQAASGGTTPSFTATTGLTKKQRKKLEKEKQKNSTPSGVATSSTAKADGPADAAPDTDSVTVGAASDMADVKKGSAEGAPVFEEKEASDDFNQTGQVFASEAGASKPASTKKNKKKKDAEVDLPDLLSTSEDMSVDESSSSDSDSDSEGSSSSSEEDSS
ncbi:unnamed protein product, partial [Amoebophrya sp. A25]